MSSSGTSPDPTSTHAPVATTFLAIVDGTGGGSATSVVPPPLSPYQQLAAAGGNADLAARLGADRLAELLERSDSPSAGGTPATRLRRILARTGAVVPDNAVLQGLIAAQTAIDEKILRGRSGPPLGAGVPSADDRALIGGHSNSILTARTSEIEIPENPDNLPTAEGGLVTVNANGTRGVKFRKLLREDLGGHAGKVVAGGADSLLRKAITAVDRARASFGVARALGDFPGTITLKGKDFGPGDKAYEHHKRVHDARKGEANGTAATFDQAYVKFQAATATLTSAAAAATAIAPQTRHIAAFDAIMQRVLALASSIAAMADNVAEPTAPKIEDEVTAMETAYSANGPVFSQAKISTLAPTALTEDDILLIGDEVAALVPTLLRYEPPVPQHIDRATVYNRPPHEAQVDTKPQQVRDIATRNVLWVTMKSGVTFRAGPVKSVDAGGTLISSYPTSQTSLPLDPVYPAKDTDRFTAIASVPDIV